MNIINFVWCNVNWSKKKNEGKMFSIIIHLFVRLVTQPVSWTLVRVNRNSREPVRVGRLKRAMITCDRYRIPRDSQNECTFRSRFRSALIRTRSKAQLYIQLRLNSSLNSRIEKKKIKNSIKFFYLNRVERRKGIYFF